MEKFKTIRIVLHSYSLIPTFLSSGQQSRTHLDIADGDRVTGCRGLSQNLAILPNVHDSSTRGANSPAVAGGLGVREGDGSEISERNKRAIGLEILDNPFSIGLTEVTLGASGEFVGYGLAISEVLDGGRSTILSGSLNGDLDRVTLGNGDTAEVIGIVGVPFVPGAVGGLAALVAEVDAGLENGSLAGITVNTNPGRGAGLLFGAEAEATAATWGGDTGDGELAGDGGVVGADQNGTSPIGTILSLGGVGKLEDLLGGAVDEGRVAVTLLVGATSFFASLTLLGERSSQSSTGKKRAGENGSELHFG